MYQQFFNFTEAPFTIAPDPHFFYMSYRHQEGLAHLLYGINQGGGFVALTGEVGTGKTTLCQCLLQQLPEHVDLALVLNPKLSASDLLATTCDELAIEYDNGRLDLKYLLDCLNHHLLKTHAHGRRTVLMIDEAQNLSSSVLEQIRLLTNLETQKEKLLQIILVGQPELQNMLASKKLRQLNQRINARYHLRPLDKQESSAYIRHRLSVSHGAPNLFSGSALNQVYRYSGGVPRLINLICDRSLLGAYASNKKFINAGIVHHAVKELDPSLFHHAQRPRLYFLLFTLLLVAMTAAFLQQPAPPPVTRAQPHKSSSLSLEQHPPTPATDTNPPAMNTLSRPATAEYPDFQTTLSTAQAGLTEAYNALLQHWQLAPQAEANCEDLPVNCLVDDSSWRDLVVLNRPVLLEFETTLLNKRYLLLTGLEQSRGVFSINGQNHLFPLHEILKYWNGNFLMFWQSPLPAVKFIYPGTRSNAVIWLRRQLGQTENAESTYFDSALKDALLVFQRQQQLEADGIAGPRTLIHLQNMSPDQYGPRLSLSE